MRFYKPEYLDVRVIKRFSILPIRAGNETRWLERVMILQKYIPGAPSFGWHNVKFLEGDAG